MYRIWKDDTQELAQQSFSSSEHGSSQGDPGYAAIEICMLDAADGCARKDDVSETTDMPATAAAVLSMND